MRLAVYYSKTAPGKLIGDYNNSFVAFFARRNFVVVGYSPRVQGLTAGSCESGAIDCSPMADWGLETIVDEAAFIRQQIANKYPQRSASSSEFKL
jgi:hypothetical protein